MTRLRAIDQRLIDWVQAIYLWIFDRTGMQVGVCTFLLLAPLFLIRGVDGWGAFIALAMCGLYSFLLVAAQTTGLATFNMMARGWRESPFRLAAMALDVGFLVADLITLDLARMAGDVILIVVFLYLSCIQLRDREPPEHRQLAPEGSSA